MRLEIVSAADFLVHLLRLQTGQLSEPQLDNFKLSLTQVLRRRYRDHWFPDRPNRGSGYRCLRINGKMDPVIAQACSDAGLTAASLHSLFPSELTMWIDPAEVSYRIGENGSICVLYERTEPDPEEMQPPMAQQQFESCKDSLIHEHGQFSEQIAAFVSSWIHGVWIFKRRSWNNHYRHKKNNNNHRIGHVVANYEIRVKVSPIDDYCLSVDKQQRPQTKNEIETIERNYLSYFLFFLFLRRQFYGYNVYLYTTQSRITKKTIERESSRRRSPG